jgi:hypothetical protein
MSQSTNLRLPYLAANQAQKHVTVNEALRFLDVLVQLSIKSAALSAPPGSPADGHRYIVGAAPTGAWAGHATHVAAWQDGAWAFHAPGEGWVAWNEATGAPLVYRAGAWVNLFGGTFAGGLITELGINAATDATNKFAFYGTNMLFNTAGSIDATFNKAAAGNDASFSFKTGFSARALLGLLGGDDFTIKVSANGGTFFTGLVVDRSSGRVSLPQGMALGGLASDPGSPQNGWLWHNSTTGQLKARLDGVTRILAPDAIPFVAPTSGDYVLTTIGAGGATGTLAGAADRVDLFPFIPRADLSIDRLAVNVTTAVAASLGKIVLYASNASGQPAGLLTETGSLDFSTIGVKEATVALTLRKGVTYWIGVRHNSTATLSAWAAAATPDLTVNAPTTQYRKVLRRTVTFATAAPNPWSYVSSETANAVATAIWLQAV